MSRDRLAAASEIHTTVESNRSACQPVGSEVLERCVVHPVVLFQLAGSLFGSSDPQEVVMVDSCRGRRDVFRPRTQVVDPS
jgi:hypothetical protein